MGYGKEAALRLVAAKQSAQAADEYAARKREVIVSSCDAFWESFKAQIKQEIADFAETSGAIAPGFEEQSPKLFRLSKSGLRIEVLYSPAQFIEVSTFQNSRGIRRPSLRTERYAFEVSSEWRLCVGQEHMDYDQCARRILQALLEPGLSL